MGIQDQGTTATLHVCVTCRAGDPAATSQDCPGKSLAAALMAGDPPPGVVIEPVECLSACSSGCAIALSRPGSWTYVYGRMTQADVPEILSGAALYAQSEDGIVPWRERPGIFRKQSIARVPPQKV
ncbi:hypothetical protein Y88_3448 [Novosphingobium nitrogenifigens DSM 19370]|uniref:Metal-binding protein n=1 Tax=Novosphingobium nitrogenifigens DSM 19370 TaxID=983920 RepID=F1Z369_9SPHN|nr:DUF1636 domain-containing protein [Novosphingobium nitrogenifigens]EGD60944.1 hypothetical protein Y88_3448 [Novosphingobium nitrogenifigens DSM 19370]